MKLIHNKYIHTVKFVDGKLGTWPTSVDEKYLDNDLRTIDLFADDLISKYKLRFDFDHVITEQQLLDKYDFINELPNKEKYEEKICLL